MSKHYAISDLHGCYNIYEQVCAMLKPDDVVYFLGDAGDRGYAGWTLIKAICNNPQWVYIKGNHDEFAANSMIEMNDCEAFFSYEFSIWMNNGGQSTYEGWCNDGQPISYAYKLKKKPTLITYENPQGKILRLCHAGYTPGKELDLLWDRQHFYDTWTGEENEIIIHGHTPIPLFIKRVPSFQKENSKYQIAADYCGGHKINIDNGVFFTGCAVLLDLDTLDEIILYDKSGKVVIDE